MDVFPTIDLPPVTDMPFTWGRSVSSLMIWCHCGRTFRGRDGKRVNQHYRKHAKRCTSAKRVRRNFKPGSKITLYGL